jgi:hypothetical protein
LTPRGLSVLPPGKRFAFTIVDDTDVATVENVAPVYRLLRELGMRATKTLWPHACPEGSRDFDTSATLEDADYKEFLLQLQRDGFELTWHCATMETSERPRTLAALERFHDVFGSYPRIHVNHSVNRENIYWGPDRVDDPLIRWFAARSARTPPHWFQGHVEGSPHWWGDVCSQHIEYTRNLTFSGINTTARNPSMPYRDPARPLSRYWFSCSDAENAEEFVDLVSHANQDRLEREGGACIVATHFGKEFCRDGRVAPAVEARLRELASRPGWFPTAGELLDRLRTSRGDAALPPREWRRMQYRWAFDLVVRKLRQRARSLVRRSAPPASSHPRQP